MILRNLSVSRIFRSYYEITYKNTIDTVLFSSNLGQHFFVSTYIYIVKYTIVYVKIDSEKSIGISCQISVPLVHTWDPHRPPTFACIQTIDWEDNLSVAIRKPDISDQWEFTIAKTRPNREENTRIGTDIRCRPTNSLISLIRVLLSFCLNRKSLSVLFVCIS